MPLTTPATVPLPYITAAAELRDLLAVLRHVAEEGDAPLPEPTRAAYSAVMTLAVRAHRDAHELAENLSALNPDAP